MTVCGCVYDCVWVYVCDLCGSVYVTVCWCVYDSVCGFVYMIADIFKDQKKVSEFHKLELPVVVNCLKWVLAMEL